MRSDERHGYVRLVVTFLNLRVGMQAKGIRDCFGRNIRQRAACDFFSPSDAELCISGFTETEVLFGFV